jgi:hypothetical protein
MRKVNNDKNIYVVSWNEVYNTQNKIKMFASEKEAKFFILKLNANENNLNIKLKKERRKL